MAITTIIKLTIIIIVIIQMVSLSYVNVEITMEISLIGLVTEWLGGNHQLFALLLYFVTLGSVVFNLPLFTPNPLSAYLRSKVKKQLLLIAAVLLQVPILNSLYSFYISVCPPPSLPSPLPSFLHAFRKKLK